MDDTKHKNIEILQKTISDQQTQEQKIQRKILFFYGLFFSSLIVSLIPFSIASIFTLMICVCTLAGIYSVRSTAEEDSLLESHMTHLIKTFWRVNLYLVLTTVFGLLYVALFADYQPLRPCLNTFQRHIVYISENLSAKLLDKVFKGCKATFLEKNYNHLIITAIIAFGPILFYLLRRCIKGVILIKNNQHIPE